MPASYQSCQMVVWNPVNPRLRGDPSYMSFHGPFASLDAALEYVDKHDKQFLGFYSWSIQPLKKLEEKANGF